MTKFEEFAAPAGRLLISLIFVVSGLNKITAYDATQGYMEAMGVSGALLPIVIIAEVVFGLAVIIGFKTRIAALALAGFSILSGILFHGDFGDQNQMIMLMKNLTIAGGFILLAAHGAGSHSLDDRLANRP